MPEILTIACPSCGARVTVDENSNHCKCEYCGNAHFLQLENRTPPDSSVSNDRPQVPIPENVHFEEREYGLLFNWRWFSQKYLFLGIFCLFWDGFLCFWYGTALTANAPVIMILFPIIHLLVGIYLSYSVLAGFVNSTTVIVTDQTISIRHRPLPWVGDAEVSLSDLNQFYCKESVHRSRRGATSFTYNLFAITQSGKRIKIISSLDSPDLAQFLEQRLETRLNIKDRKVRGEMLRYG